jgi:hypothetical protein
MTDDAPGEREALGALIMPVPAGWTSQHQVTIQLPVAPGADPLDFQPNIVAIRRRLDPPDATLDAIAEERRRLLGRHLPKFEFGLTLSGQLFGQRSVRMMYTWQNGMHRVRQVLVLCAAGGQLHELTFSDASVRFRESVIEFDRWLSTLTLDPTGTSSRRGA